MKKLLLFLCLALAGQCLAADGTTVFQNGLRAFQENGPDALLGAWYPTREDNDKITKLRERLTAVTRPLGAVLDTEVFTPYKLGSRVQRLYGVIYFEKRPLWLRADYYSINGRDGFVALEFSFSPDDILPMVRSTTIP